ncbi:unnamed protein product [Rotaria sp. Silwood1]|nr:unnamed protein product [Rotaria sp. Silwood1]CAF4639962.1 unnamed protein product [Rotaria sp. Silwood1]
MLLRSPVIRRTVYYLFIIITITYIVYKTYDYYDEGYFNIFDSSDPIKRYNKYTYKTGDLIPVSGYKILQSVADPSSQKIHELYTHLDGYNELKDYFIFFPEEFYHITLTKLINNLSITDKQLEKLENEQDLLDKNNTQTKCIAKKLRFIDKNEIRLEVELKNDYIDGYLKHLRKRWDENFSELITEHCTSFYIPLAYQYKDIPNEYLLNRFNETLEQWHDIPFEIELNSIDICSYASLLNYDTILADVDEEI